MRLTILYTKLSGYIVSCIQKLQSSYNIQLLVYAYPPANNAPFNDALFSELGTFYNRKTHSNQQIQEEVTQFSPDAILVAGWQDKGYRSICRLFKKSGIPVIAGVDNQWRGTPRQYISTLISPWYLQNTIDILWVSGEQQRQFANRLGYSGSKCWDGFYSCDWNSFNKHKATWKSANERFFLYVGRYVDEKGFDTLSTAYRLYQQESSNPWNLICAGKGDHRQLLLDAGAEDYGFVQPDKLPELMASASAFILPSRFEPWGVVLHEATTTGLPLIASDACGAAVHLLRPHFNGYSFQNGNSHELKEAMLALDLLNEPEWQRFSDNSFQLSRQYTPERWAQTLYTGIKGFALRSV